MLSGSDSEDRDRRRRIRIGLSHVNVYVAILSLTGIMAEAKPLRARAKPPATVLADVETLLEWCRTHNSSRLVTPSVDPDYCDDVVTHAKMWNILRYAKSLTHPLDAQVHAKALGMLDSFVMGNWRVRKRGRIETLICTRAFQYA
jgi:hypothetical protein